MYTNLGEMLPAILSARTRESGAPTQEQLREACAQFEAVLLSQMLRCMKATVPEGGLMKKSPARKIFEEMLDDRIAGEMARGGSIGLGEMIVRDMTNAAIAGNSEHE